LASRFFVREPGHHISQIKHQCFHGSYLSTNIGDFIGPESWSATNVFI
jgi:hypothetical protein